MDTSCQKCGAKWNRDTDNCETCGAEVSDALGPDAASVDPYALPESHAGGPRVSDGAGAWRRKKTLIIDREPRLPDRCVKCNAPAEERLHVKISWHKQWVYVMVLLNVLLYALVALAVRKKAEVEVPLCLKHSQRRSMLVKASWMGGLASLVMMGGGFTSDSESGVLVGLAGCLVLVPAAIVGTVAARPVFPEKIDDERLWLRKCSANFLDSLPEAPREF